jgi:hypothetical protein
MPAAYCCQTHEVDDVDPPLHEAARRGLPVKEVERRLREAPDVDEVHDGRTALWEAVMYRHHAIARLLAEAGADPWRTQIGGWSPGRLALAGPEPAVFGAPDESLTPAELKATGRARRLIAAVGDPEIEGMSFAFLTHVDSAEAAGRLRAVPIEVDDFAEWALDPWSEGMTDHEVAHTAGVTDVRGGCVLTQWAGFAAATPGLLSALTHGTFAYAMTTDPKTGPRGITFYHGRPTAFDLMPGSGRCDPEDTAQDVLRAYLYRGHPLAHCCDAAALTPADPQPFTGPPTKLLRLPPWAG